MLIFQRDIHVFAGVPLVLDKRSLYHIRLRFSEEVVDDVTATRWHKTQTVTYNDDGSAIIEFRVDGLNEITWWVLGYGDRVKVLAPSALRQKIARMAQRIVDLNAEQEMG